VEALPPGKLPNSFDRVEIWAVRWQIVEKESLRMFFPPGSMKPGMMILALSVITTTRRGPVVLAR